MRRVHRANAFGCCDKAYELNVTDTFLAQKFHRVYRTAARRKHRVDDDRWAMRDINRHFRVVRHRFRSLFVAIDTDVCDARLRKERE